MVLGTGVAPEQVELALAQGRKAIDADLSIADDHAS